MAQEPNEQYRGFVMELCQCLRGDRLDHEVGRGQSLPQQRNGPPIPGLPQKSHLGWKPSCRRFLGCIGREVMGFGPCDKPW